MTFCLKNSNLKCYVYFEISVKIILVWFSISGELNEKEEIAKIEEQSKKSKAKPMKRQDRKTKDAAMKEIYSESQRMFRESGLKVGYHRPKQRTLDEFLNRYISFSNIL